MNRMEFEPIIGLEVHVELKTKSKMFCGCPADYFGREPNTVTCPVCLGLPGALPFPNRKAVEWTMMLGLALGCQINPDSKFDRKHYFYPDLPKGYQITQYDQPLCHSGSLVILGRSGAPTPESDSGQARMTKKIRIRRVHLEEDTGKLLHSNQIPNYDGPADASLVDFNRSGLPLVEVVTEPDFRASVEAKEFLKKIQLIIRYLGISDADMEEGSMRIEPSISLRALNVERSTLNEEYPDYRVEVKNINSFRFAQKAIEYEIKRQTEILERGEKVVQETRGWNEAKGQTFSQRSKEEAHDYRYFPEPDIPPMNFSDSLISDIGHQISELPDEKIQRYIEMGLKAGDAEIIVGDTNTARYFEEAAAFGNAKGVEGQKIANLIVNRKINIETLSPIQLIESILKIDDSKSLKMEPAELEAACFEIISQNQRAAEDYRQGKKQSLQFLLGLVLKKFKGKAEPTEVATVLEALMSANYLSHDVIPDSIRNPEEPGS